MMAAVSNENGRVGFASNTEKKGEKKKKFLKVWINILLYNDGYKGIVMVYF